jgi:hypothetical protein
MWPTSPKHPQCWPWIRGPRAIGRLSLLGAWFKAKMVLTWFAQAHLGFQVPESFDFRGLLHWQRCAGGQNDSLYARLSFAAR